MSDLTVALAAAARARTLVADLDRSDTTADRHQVAAGVRHELDTILQVLHSATQTLATAAAGNRSGKVRADASDTSRQAGEALLRAGTYRHAVLKALGDAREGLTDFEIQQVLEMSPSTERPRRGELVDAELVQESGATRKHHGRNWNVWKITDRGRQALVLLLGDRPEATSETVSDEFQPTLFSP